MHLNSSDAVLLITWVLFSVGNGWNMSLVHYGPSLRLVRRAFHEEFKSDILARYDVLQTSAIHCLMRTLVVEPDNFKDNIKQCATLQHETGLYPSTLL